MSVHPIQIAIEVDRETVPRKPRSYCSKEFFGTVVTLVISAPLLVWVFTILCRMVAQSAQEPLCDRLLKVDHTVEAIWAIIFIMGLITVYPLISIPYQDWCATVALLLVFSASISVLSGFPNVGDKTSLGIFHNRSLSSPTVFGGNNSEYWKNNFKSCVCKTEACEDYVYRNYLVNLYRLDTRDGYGLDFSGYKRLSHEDEAKRTEPSAAQNANGTSLRNGDTSSPSSDSGYHEVCYSEDLGNQGIKTMCYSCNACEEKRLGHKLRRQWKIGNQLFILSLLLIALILIVFLAELWARYMDPVEIE